MKKTFLHTIYTGFFTLLIFSVLISQVAQSQALSEAQRKKLCNSNKVMLAEYERKLVLVNSELSSVLSKTQIEQEKDNMAFIKKIKTDNIMRIYSNGQDVPFYTLSQEEELRFNKITAQYKFSGCDGTKKGSEYSHYLEYCLGDLNKIIATRIQKSELLQQQRPELLKEKSRIEKQIASIRNKLIALRCK